MFQVGPKKQQFLQQRESTQPKSSTCLDKQFNAHITARLMVRNQWDTHISGDDGFAESFMEKLCGGRQACVSWKPHDLFTQWLHSTHKGAKRVKKLRGEEKLFHLRWWPPPTTTIPVSIVAAQRHLIPNNIISSKVFFFSANHSTFPFQKEKIAFISLSVFLLFIHF